MSIVVLRSAEAVAEEAARRLRAAARRAIESRGRFNVALSGGSTPRPLFELLAGDAWRDRLPWDGIHVFWSDERCVPPEHPDSNFGLAATSLLRHVDVPPRQVHRMRGELGPVDGATAYEATLDFEVGRVGLDFVLLGLGTDGHTASLFPAQPESRPGVEPEATRRRVAPAVAPDGSPRITLTLPELDAAAEVLFLVTGAAKRDIVQRILGPGSVASPTLPAALVAPAQPPAWLLDEAAAGQLIR